MNAFMNIQVRIATQQAQARIKQLEGQLARMDRQLYRSGGGARHMSGGLGQAMTAGTKFGNQLQWTGRQLQYNFAMPIALATGMAVKFALENEKAMVRVKKVYGDAGQSVEDFGGEVKALERNFRALSDHFGVHRAEVIGIAGDWAAAGATGIALAKAVKLTLETMVLGEMEAKESTEALLAVQGQYNLSVQELSKAMDTLNMIENETDVSMKQLITSMARAAGTARQAGVSVQELAAMTAALVPEAGQASNAGNGLKTIISRLLAPTEDAAAVLGKMGLSMGDLDWQSLNVTQRLQALSDQFVKLPEGQRAVVSEYVAGRYQITRFSQAMVDMADRQGDYHKAMNASGDEAANFKQRVRELNAVLESNPQKVKQVGVMLQNSMADIVIPLIPIITYFGQRLAALGQAFEGLDPRIQVAIGAVLLWLLLFGPLLRYMGSSITLFRTFGHMMTWMGGRVLFAQAAMARFLLYPFAKVAAGFMLVGKAGLAMGALLVKGMKLGAASAAFAWFMNVLKVNMAAGMFVLRGIWTTQWALMRMSFIIIMSPMRNAWGRMMAGLIITFGLYMRAMTPIMATVAASMRTIWAALWTAMAAIMKARQLGMVATTLAMSAAWMIVTQQMAIIWSSFITFWTASTAAGASTIQRIWAFLAVAARGFGSLIAFAFVAPFARIGAAARGVVPALLIALKALPAFVARLAPMVARGFLKMFPYIFRALTSWVGLALTALLGIAYAFRNQISAAFRNIQEAFSSMVGAMPALFGPLINFFNRASQWVTDAFWRLPKGVRDAMLAVVKIVHWAAMKVYELFSYLNPFARHSPSLVESVTSGADAILAQYARMGNAGGAFAKAVKDLAAFKRAAAALGIDEWSDKRMEVASNIPGILPLFNALTGDLNALNVILAKQGRLVDAQEIVVNAWKGALNDANAAVDAQQNKLNALQETLSALEDAYSSHEKAMQDYANAPLVGMRAMSDAIFENEMAQKRLQLQMMDWEDANGSVDDFRKRLASLYGEAESARGEMNDLRLSGAGSDILGPIQQQIEQMEQAASQMEGAQASSPISQMEEELARLQREAERMQLQQSITFDPLTRAIEQAADMTKELSFEEIISGINRERAAMEALAPQIDIATEAVKAQEQAVKDVERARDAIQATYDAESAKLDQLEEQYRQTESLIRDIESALNDVASAAREAGEAKRRALGPDGGEQRYALEKFDANAAADFADVGGSGNVPREFPEIGDQSAMIDDLTKQLQSETAALMGSFDIVGGIKNAYQKAKDWVMGTPLMEFLFGTFDRTGDLPIHQQLWNAMSPLERIEQRFPIVKDIFDGIKSAMEQAGNGAQWLGDQFEKGYNAIRNIVEPILAWLGSQWRLIEPDIRRVVDAFVQFALDIWNEFGAEVAKWGELFKPFVEAIQNIFSWVAAIVIAGFAILLPIWKAAWSILGHVIGPILDTIVGVVTNVFQVVRGVIQVILALINGDWKLLFDGLYNIVQGTFGAIWALIEGVVKVVVKIVWGFVSGIVGFFKWLWDELVGHSIVPDIVNGIIKVFGWLWGLAKSVWDNVLKPLWDVFMAGQKAVYGVVKFLVESVFTVMKGLFSLYTWIWNNILKPVINVFWDLVTGRAGVKEIVGTLVQVVSNIVTGLAGLPMAIWNNVLKPIIDKFTDMVDRYIKPLVNAFIRLIAGLGNNIGEGIARGINVAVGAVNKLIEGLNWIGSKVPGLNFSIGAIGTVTWANWNPPQFAAGGQLPTSKVGGGFVTNGARAIVGEGNSRYPEYVIPTDPTYRSRAEMLLSSAIGDIGAERSLLGTNGTLARATGGWGVDLGAVGSAIGGAVSNATEFVRRGAVMATFGPMKAVADRLLDAMSDKPDPMKRMIRQALNNAYDWAMGADNALPDVPPPGEMGYGALGTGWRAIEDFLAANGNVRRYITSTVRPGDPGNHGRGLAIDYSVPGHGNRGYNDPGLRAIFDALLPVGGNLRELILAGAPFNIKHGRQVPGYAWGQPGQPGNHWNHVHAAANSGISAQRERNIPLAAGGIVTAPTNALVGEAGAEAVLPLNQFWARMEEGFRSIVVSIQTQDFNDAIRSVREETAFNNGLGNIDSSIDTNFDNLESFFQTANEAFINQVAVTMSDGFFSLGDIMTAGFTGLGDIMRGEFGRVLDTLTSTDVGMVNEIRGMFERAGVTIATSTETETARLLRIASEVANGRTLEHVQASINRLANIPGLATGGIVRARSGGTLVRVGEGGEDELVIPASKAGGGAKHYHFYGDLSFPNVSDGTDAATFLRNLEAMVD